MYHHHTIKKSKDYLQNYLYIQKHFGGIRQNPISRLTPQQIATNSWNNPVEALQSIRLIESNHSAPHVFAKPLPKTTQPNQQEVLPETSEWEKYINWDPEEPSTSSTKEGLQNFTENSYISESVDFQTKNHANIYQTIPSYSSENQVNVDQTTSQNPYKSMSKSQQSELECQHRLNKIYVLTNSFTKKDYLRIFPISNSKANRDFEYAFKAGVLTKSHDRREIVYSFVKRDPSWIPFPLTQFIQDHNPPQQ